ncbi:MAG TPA: ATP-binding protein [Thermoanaerobaculia bacterium]|nr:ATP-binding protein [Thermoanaerobaculia bacterium]
MRRPRSLQGRIALWSGAVFFVLYGAACGLVAVIDARNHRTQMEVLLYAEAESLASYYASSHKLDFPELREPESSTPFLIWLRVLRGGRVIVQTPGSPTLPVAEVPAAELGRFAIREAKDGHAFGVVPHEIWNESGTWVEAMAPLKGLEERQQDLLFALGIAGLLLIPLAVLGVLLLSRQALQPMDALVSSVRSLDSDRLDERLQVPGAVTEISQLTREFNQLLDRLEHSVATMQRFTADASHELRTPLSILRTGLEVALRKDRPPEEYRELLRENLVEIERVQRIVEGLLTLARSQQGEGRKMPETPVDLSAVVRAAVESIRPLAAERRIGLETRVASGLVVLGDTDTLRLLVLNLLDNAVKYTPEGRTVHLRLEDGGETVRFEVCDEGPGVPPGDRPFIFDRFFRGQGPHASGTAAGGLGLSVVRWVAEIHGGTVRLLDGPGPGATFEVMLPAALPDADHHQGDVVAGGL